MSMEWQVRERQAHVTDYAYQEAGIEWLKRSPRAILGDDPGLGKTRQIIMAAEPPLLVVSPADLEDTWITEIRRWRPALELDTTWVSYQSLVNRLPNAKGHLRLLSDRPAREYVGPWATVACDEGHHLKGRKTKWSLALERIRTDRLWLATGTPIPNWAHELYMPLRLLHPKDRRWTSYWRWVRTWFDVDQAFEGGKHLEIGDLQKRWTWEEFATGNELDATLLRRERDDVLSDLPPLSVTERRLDMTPAQRRAYQSLKRDYLAELEASGREIVAWSDGARFSDLRKMAVGPDIFDAAEPAGCKMAAWREVLDETAGQPIVAFCHHRPVAQAARRVASKRGRRVAVVSGEESKEQRTQAVRSFQDGLLDTLVGTFDTLAEGRTLTAAAVVVRIERSYKPSKNEQAIRRLHRIGQARPVHVIDLITKGSVDAGMRRLLEGKTDQQAKALKAIEIAAALDG